MTEPLEIQVARLQEIIKGRDEALKLQAAEYHRRLTELNHAHETAVETLATYLPREQYDLAHKELDNRVRLLENDANQARGALSQAKSDAAALTVKISLATGVGAILVNVLLRAALG